MGRYDLRLSEREFWGATPRRMHALIGRRNAAERRADARLAVAVHWLLRPWVKREDLAGVELRHIYPSLDEEA